VRSRGIPPPPDDQCADPSSLFIKPSLCIRTNRYVPGVGIVVTDNGVGVGAEGIVPSTLEVFISPKVSDTDRCLHGMLLLEIEVPETTLEPFPATWGGNAGTYGAQFAFLTSGGHMFYSLEACYRIHQT
jgi:hypothetical protein